MHHVTTKLSTSIGSHRIPSTLTLGGIDLNVFKDRNTDCRPPSNGALLTESCSVLKRLCVASLYSAMLSASELDENEKKTVFVGFNEDIYNFIVDDTAHLIQNHSDDLQRIDREWTEKYGFPSCTVSECARSSRHYGRGRRERTTGISKDQQEDDALYSFYESIYDRLHNFVAHLYDIGLRVDESKLLEDVQGDGKEDDLEGLSVDKLFEAERDRIRMKREQCNLELDRLEDAVNKFTIQTAEAKKGGMTLLDALFEAMAVNENVNKETVRRIMEYFKQNGYDSDSVEMDLQEVPDSNIYGVIKKQVVVDWMAAFIRTKNCM